MNDLEAIIEASRTGYAATARSIVTTLVEHGWTEPQVLDDAYAELAASTDPFVAAACFTLPWRVRLPGKWFKQEVGDATAFSKFYAATIVQTLVPTPLDVFSPPPPSSRAATRVTLCLPIRDRPRQFYEQYLAALDSSPKRQVTVAAGKSGRAISLAEFEATIVRQLRVLARHWLDVFLPLYSVSCRDPHATDVEWLDRMFVMTRGGRILVSASDQSAPRASPDDSRNAGDVDTLASGAQRLADFGRKRVRPSVYEHYLLHAANVAESGNPELAVVHSVMVLELMANQLIREHCVRPVTAVLKPLRPQLRQAVLAALWTGDAPELADGSTSRRPARRINWQERKDLYLPAVGITMDPSMKKDLDTLIRLRNAIVHGDAETVTPQEARSALDTAFRVARRWMECVLSPPRSGEKRAT